MYEINWGDLTPEQFLADYWQKKPLLIRNAFPDFEPLLEPDELAGLALEEQVESRLIQFDPDSQRWTLTKGPLEESTFSTLPERDWTLLIQAVDHYLDEAGDLLDAFAFIPRWRIDDLMVSYAVPGGGVGPHYDNYDVFLLQASGSRRWELGAIEDSQSPRVANVPVLLLSEFEATESYELQPGDMLYLPPQLAHNGIATSADCMTYSIGFRAPSRKEMLNSFADLIGDRLSSEDRYSDPSLTRQAHPGEIQSDALTKVQAMLTELVQNPDTLSDWFGRLVTEPKYPEDTASVAEAEVDDWLAEIELTDGVALAANARLSFIRESDELQIFCNGERFRSEPLAWLVQLCDTRHSGPIDTDPASTEALRTLIRLGGVV